MADLYHWTPQQVAELTPMQASMYARSASAAGRASGDGSWHYDARFPGKKVVTRKGGKR